MKKSLIIFAVVAMTGCKPDDNDIKKAIAVSAKEELMFAGVNYSVDKGVVTLQGNCPSEELRSKVEKKVHSSPGVKKVVNQIQVGPVVLDNDFVLKQKLDSVLAS